jgi:hypothetical protein
MSEHDSPRFPRVQRCVTPSPLRATPTQSRELLHDLYSSNSSPPPRFLLDALDAVSETSETSVPVELPKHFLPDFPFRVVNGRADPTYA